MTLSVNTIQKNIPHACINKMWFLFLHPAFETISWISHFRYPINPMSLNPVENVHCYLYEFLTFMLIVSLSVLSPGVFYWDWQIFQIDISYLKDLYIIKPMLRKIQYPIWKAVRSKDLEPFDTSMKLRSVLWPRWSFISWNQFREKPFSDL